MPHNGTLEPRLIFEDMDDLCNTPTPDASFLGYRELAYAIVTLALTEDTPEQLRTNPQIHFFAGQVLGLDVAVLLEGMARREGKVQFPKLYASHGSDHNNEPQEEETDDDLD